MKPNNRQISASLLNMLDKGGVYNEITEIVKLDPYLDMEFRGDTGAIVYYRGGKILTIDEKKGLLGLDENYYCNSGKDIISPNICNIFDYFCNAKHIVDKYEGNITSKLGEKEIQQRVVYENNLSINSDNTDYFIADIEWVDKNLLEGRADIVAFYRAYKTRKLRLTLIEVKQGERAVKTKNSNPGLIKHFEDYRKLVSNDEYIRCFSADMLVVLWQKHKLGLVKGLDVLYSDGNQPTIEDDIDFVFLLANYHYYSKELREEAEFLPDDCKFFVSSFMGYGLYNAFKYSKKEIVKLFPKPFE